MKKLLLILLPLWALFFSSCQEDFNPEGELKEKYSLSCILRGDTTFQVAFLASAYRNGSTGLPFSLAASVIRIWYRDTVYVLKDSAVNGSNSESLRQFFIRGFMPDPGEKIEIEARLPNGKKLSSVSYVPRRVKVDSTESDTLIPMPGQARLRFSWKQQDANVYSMPRLRIIYLKEINGNKVRYEKQVPYDYINKDGRETPVYPPLSGANSIWYDQKVIDRAMRDISEGDINKENYTINVMAVDVLSVDRFLGAYYNAFQTQSDGFTVKLDQTDYTNITGGMGIFGAFSKTTYYVWINCDYIRSFRYNAAVPSH